VLPVRAGVGVVPVGVGLTVAGMGEPVAVIPAALSCDKCPDFEGMFRLFRLPGPYNPNIRNPGPQYQQGVL